MSRRFVEYELEMWWMRIVYDLRQSNVEHGHPLLSAAICGGRNWCRLYICFKLFILHTCVTYSASHACPFCISHSAGFFSDSKLCNAFDDNGHSV